MPKSLKLYIAGVVALGAVALVAATLVFPVDPAIAIGYDPAERQPTESRILLGVAFWTSLALVGSALPVQLPRGTQHAVAIAPIMGASSWVARRGGMGRGNRHDRGPRARVESLVRHPGQPCRPGHPCRRRGPRPARLSCAIADRPSRANFVAAMSSAAVFLILNLLLASILLGAPNRSTLVDVVRRRHPGHRRKLGRAGAAGLAHGDHLRRPVVGDRPVRGPALLHATGVPALRRDARHVHPDDRRARRGRGQARPVHRPAQPAGQGDRGRHRAGHARDRRRAGGPGVGRPAPRRRQDRRAGQRPEEAGAAQRARSG